MSVLYMVHECPHPSAPGGPGKAVESGESSRVIRVCQQPASPRMPTNVVESLRNITG
ncbi:hypothetical protein M407DRAFT_175793 [Tulasnella calospora MUT 4182]|uniref:Uncharacterized protein n=1 Tax=Tulasnella calospora MUT 4182 TaxID=1051891 RepID=A0A0C3QM99_9AGAM|nr:hypothetical protein M407DRAFT_175793 [Tulasnella calospora MUT 4182]